MMKNTKIKLEELICMRTTSIFYFEILRNQSFVMKPKHSAIKQAHRQHADDTRRTFHLTRFNDRDWLNSKIFKSHYCIFAYIDFCDDFFLKRAKFTFIFSFSSASSSNGCDKVKYVFNHEANCCNKHSNNIKLKSASQVLKR